MDKFDDVGEYVPFARKELYSSSVSDDDIFDDEATTDENDPNRLKALWPEPKWPDLASTANDREVLIRWMYIYKALAPAANQQIKYKGVSQEQFNTAYIDVVNKLKQAFEKDFDIEQFDRFKTAFLKWINKEENAALRYSAARVQTRKVFFPCYESANTRAKARTLATLRWPEKISLSELSQVPIKLTFNKGTETKWAIGKYNQKSATYSSSQYFQTELECIAEIYKAILLKRPVKTEPDEPIKPYNPRKMTQYLIDVAPLNKNPDELMADHHLRALQFGNALTQIEKQRFVDNTYFALEQLVKLIQADPKRLFKDLAFAFAARGISGAAAHYEPNLKVINLTKTNGPGAIAHEVFHHLDHKLAVMAGFGNKMCSDEYVKHAGFLNVNPFLTRFESLMHGILSLKDYRDCANSLSRQRGGKNYWSLPSELLARAFEAYIQDKLQQNEIMCSWLAYGTNPEQYDDFRPEFNPYPSGDERKKNFSLFENFFLK